MKEILPTFRPNSKSNRAMPFDLKTQQFIQEHWDDDTRLLALQAARYPGVDMPAALTQIAGRQIAAAKIPTWYDTQSIEYPRHLSLEQCSSEITARYKASLLKGETLVDLTGGLGVDCYFISQKFKQTVYVEQQEELCKLAAHNFPLLGAHEIRIIHGNGIEHLRNMEKVSCIYLDPARRNQAGGKTVAIADCEPNLKEISSLLLQKADTVAAKLSPMLDLSLALRELPAICEVHILSVRNECKELLFILRNEFTAEIPIHCINLKGEKPELFTFSREQEQACTCEYTSEIGKYLYEPNASILKAGAYKATAALFQLKKLHPNSHLYTSDQLVSGFPGRIFVCDSVFAPTKKEWKQELEGICQANVTVRNFPISVADLRKRIKLKEGGEIYLFATTLADERKVLLKCRKTIFP